MDRLRGIACGAASGAAYGLNPLFALPLFSAGMGVDSILFYRFFAAAAAIGALMLVRGEDFRASPAQLRCLLAMAFLMAASSETLFLGYTFMPAGVASTILFLYPVFVASIMALVFGERFTWVSAGAVALSFAGVALLYGGGGESLDPFGVFVVVLSALTYALYLIAINKSGIGGLGGGKISFYALLMGSGFLLLKAGLSGGLQLPPDARAVANLAMLAVVPTLLSTILAVYSIRYVGSTATAILGALEPLTAVCVGVAVFGEPVTARLALGVLAIVAAVSMVAATPALLGFSARAGAFARRISGRRAG